MSVFFYAHYRRQHAEPGRSLIFCQTGGTAILMVRFHQCLTMFKPRPVLELPDKPAFLSRERDPDDNASFLGLHAGTQRNRLVLLTSTHALLSDLPCQPVVTDHNSFSAFPPILYARSSPIKEILRQCGI